MDEFDIFYGDNICIEDGKEERRESISFLVASCGKGFSAQDDLAETLQGLWMWSWEKELDWHKAKRESEKEHAARKREGRDTRQGQPYVKEAGYRSPERNTWGHTWPLRKVALYMESRSSRSDLVEVLCKLRSWADAQGLDWSRAEQTAAQKPASETPAILF